jgi:hypothetical protein
MKNAGMMGCWDAGMPEYWNAGMPGCWKAGMLGYLPLETSRGVPAEQGFIGAGMVK